MPTSVVRMVQLERLLEYLMLDLLFEGGFLYWIIEMIYIMTFNRSQRQKRSGERALKDASSSGDNGEIPDWENPKVVGRFRRRAHAPLRSFPDIPISVAFWSKRYQQAGWGDKETEDDAPGSPRKRKTSMFLPSTEVDSKAFKKEELTTNIMYLTGLCGEPDRSDPWRFKLVGEPGEAPRDWEQPTHSDLGRDWSDIALPGHWQLQGHDIPIYTNTSYPFAFDPPRARRTGDWKLAECDVGIGSSPEPAHPNGSSLHEKEPGENPTGLYRRSFSLPKTWVDPSMPAGMGAQAELDATFFAALPEHRVFLVFEGVDAAFNVYVNGEHVGYSQDSCLSSEFEISDALEKREPGREHVVAVEVMRWCDGSYLEDQDKWWLSGIYREVYLLRKPATHICDYEFSSVLMEEERDGETQIDAEYSVAVLVEETYPSETPLAVRAELRKLDTNTPMGTGNAVSVSYGLVESNKDLPMRENANGLTNVESETGLCEESGFVDEDGEHMETHADWCRKQVRKFYEQHNPAKLADVPAILAKYKGSESEILHLLHEKYHIPEPRCSSFCVRDARKRKGCAEISGKVAAPALWTAESPTLYVLVITLHPSMQEAKDFNSFMGAMGNTVPLDIESTRVGFRTVSFSTSSDPAQEGKLCVNNVPITLCGVNRHEFHTLRGRSVSEKDMMHDASLLKQFNFNAVRLSHYPTHPRWLEICDECGLYVVDEANIETHGFQALGQATAYLSSHPDWQDAMLSRVTRMYERDKNHTSIIAWSLGNESGCGTTTRIMADWIRNRDFFRCVQYESGGARTTTTDIICPMYQRPAWLRRHADKDPKMRPVILCEYAHAMGNSGGCLQTYWADVWGSRYPRIQGGFVWDMIDQGLQLTPGCKYYGDRDTPGFGYGGDFGDLPNTKQFCINGLFGPDRLPHPMAYEVKACMSPVTVSLVEDRGDAGDEDEEGVAAEEEEEEEKEERSLNTVRNCFKDVARRNVRLRVQNRRSFRALDDLEMHVVFRCNLSAVGMRVLPEGFSDNVPVSVDPYKAAVPCASLAAGGTMDVSVRDLFESVYEKSRDHALEQMLAMPSEAATPPSLLPYLQSRNISEAWIEVDIGVRKESETAYLPACHTIYRQALPSEALLSALQRVADVKATERGYNMAAIGLSTSSVRKSIGAGISSPTKERSSSSSSRPSSAAHPQRSASILGAPSGSRFKGEQLIGDKALKFSRGVHCRRPPGSSPSNVRGGDSVPAKILDDTTVLVEWGNGAAAEVGEQTGTLLAWHDEEGHPFLSDAQPLGLCLYRAPIDNDRGGGPLSYHERWQAAGYHSLRPSPKNPRDAVLSARFIDTPTPTGARAAREEEGLLGGERERALAITVDWTQQSATNPDTIVPAVCTLLFLPSGAIEVSFEVTPSATLPILPRVGVRLSCPIETSMEGDENLTATWLGQGPHESYPDRTQCNSLGLYSAPLGALHTPYVVPGENGMRLDPRFIAIRGIGGSAGALVAIPASQNGFPVTSKDASEDAGTGTHAGAVEGYGFTVSPFSLEQLDSCHHNHMLTRGPENCAFVHVDAVHMGVGGYDSWSPNVDYEYQISPALPPIEGEAGSRFRDSTIKGSVLLAASRWSKDHGSFLYNEFQRIGLW